MLPPEKPPKELMDEPDIRKLHTTPGPWARAIAILLGALAIIPCLLAMELLVFVVRLYAALKHAGVCTKREMYVLAIASIIAVAAAVGHMGTLDIGGLCATHLSRLGYLTAFCWIVEIIDP